MLDSPNEDPRTAVRVRTARPDELGALSDLAARSFRALGPPHYTAAQVELALAGSPEHRRGPVIRVDPGLLEDGTYFVAEVDGALAGCGGWSARHPTVADSGLPSPRGEVRAMFVAPERAGRGVGGALLRASEEAIARAGFDVAYLVATASGRVFYERAGYEALGFREATLSAEVSLPLTLMRRVLPARISL